MARAEGVVRVLVAPLDADTIELRWDRRLDGPTKHIAREIADGLEELEAVECVDMRRYSARVSIANHVRQVREVIQDIVEMFEDTEFVRSPAFRMTEPRVRFELIVSRVSIVEVR